MALAEVATVWPGAISALAFVLDADDQSELQALPENSPANGPVRKLCMADAEMAVAAGSLGRTPKAAWNAWSTEVLAADVGVE